MRAKLYKCLTWMCTRLWLTPTKSLGNEELKMISRSYCMLPLKAGKHACSISTIFLEGIADGALELNIIEEDLARLRNDNISKLNRFMTVFFYWFRSGVKPFWGCLCFFSLICFSCSQTDLRENCIEPIGGLYNVDETWCSRPISYIKIHNVCINSWTNR